MQVSKIFILALMASSSIPAIALANDAQLSGDVIISNKNSNLPKQEKVSKKNPSIDSARDAGALVETVPGAAIVRNGPQTGIVQLRGLSQDRVKIKIDGMEINPACPNHMDPPLHYVDPSNIESLAVIAGVTSVSNGGDSIGGSVIVNTAKPSFSETNGTLSGDLGLKYFSANSGYEGNLGLNLGFNNAAIAFKTSSSHGDNLVYADDKKASLTGYDINKYQIDSALKIGENLIDFGVGLHRASNVGTPSLGMDMIKDEQTSAKIGLERDFGNTKLKASAFHSDIDHVMDNYTMRTYTATASKMKAPARSIDNGFNIAFDTKRGESKFKYGVDGHFNDFDVWLENTSSVLQSQSFVNSKRDRIGAYGEYETKLTPHLKTIIGVRYDNVKSDSDNINKISMMQSASLKNAFNAADKSKSDDLFDATAAARLHINDGFIVEAAVARKSRAPSIVERYIWSPSSTYGAADGKTYLGNLNLKPEVSNQASLSADINRGGLSIKPTAFYNRVDNYIQGSKTAAATAAGADLQFANIDAELYGIDGKIDYKFNDIWSFNSITSFVRGKDLTHNDNLYRIAPLNGTASINHTKDKLKTIVELKWADKQDKVSSYNNETKSKAYGILNLRAQYSMTDKAALNFGVENLFDQYYYNHLSGINRVNDTALGGDLPISVKVPEAGRSFYINYSLKF